MSERAASTPDPAAAPVGGPAAASAERQATSAGGSANGATASEPASPVGRVGDGDPAVDADGALRLLDLDSAPPGTYGELEPASPPLIDAQGRVRLSFSRVDTYGNCPRKFRYAYVDKLPGRPGPHLSFGTSIHAALEDFYDRKLPECPTEEQLLGFLYERWDGSGFVDLDRDEQLAFYRHAQDVLRRFHRRCAPTYRLPAATEAWFELPIGYEATVVGSIDRVDVDDDGRLHVIDYKTNRKVKDRQRVAGSLQLAIYALACRHLFGTLPATVSLDFVVAGVEVAVAVEDLDLEGARQQVLDTAAAVRADRYEPTPNPLCDWCDYRAICPAWEGEPGQLLGPAVEHLRRLRRQVARDVRELRESEAGIARIAEELAHREAQALEPRREGQPVDELRTEGAPADGPTDRPVRDHPTGARHR
jgi:putative RecB family exonuclease